MRYQRDGFSVEAAFKKGRTLDPDHWYLHPPPEVPGLEFFFEAYRDLSTCRPPDGAIPWLAAMAYGEKKKLAEDVTETVWVTVRKMDLAERSWRLEEAGRTDG